MKIVNTIGDIYTTQAKQILESFGEVDYVSWNQDELVENIEAYDIAIIGLGLNFTADVLQKATHLKAIGTATTGLDHIDREVAKEKGIEVLSLRGETEFLETITGTAELGWGILLDLLRGISHGFESVKNYEWDRERFRGTELRGKTLGVIGLGRLGKMTARYGKAFYMNTVAHDPYVGDTVFEDLEIKKVSFEECLKTADVLSINVHLNDETENMIDAQALQLMKSTAFVLNTARGKIVDETAMLEALQNKTIAGYATDVLAGELGFAEKFESNLLVDYAKQNTNCIIAPHLGGVTHESRAATDVFIAQKVKEWIETSDS